MRVRWAVCATVAATVVAGCSVDGQAVRSPVKLDTGSNSTKLRSTTPLDPAQAQAREKGGLLGESVVFPGDVDSALTAARISTGPVSKPDDLSKIIDSAAPQAGGSGLQYGFGAGAAKESSSDQLDVAVLVYDTDAAATGAVDAMAKAWKAAMPSIIRDDPENELVTDAPGVDGLPAGTKVNESTTSSANSVNAYVPLGNRVVFLAASGVKPGWARDLVRRAYEKQAALLKTADAAPLDKRASDLAGATLAGGSDFMIEAWFGGVYRPRSWAHALDDAPVMNKLFVDTGVDAVAVDGSQVYRTKDASGSKRLEDGFADRYTDEWKPAASPTDLAAAHCRSKGFKTQCTVTHGRYFAKVEASSTDKSPTKAHQAIAAQYLLLKQLPA